MKDILQDENIVDYDSDAVAEVGEDPEPVTSASREPSRIAPNPYPERSTAQALTELRGKTTLDEPIINNELDEQQQRYIEENERYRRLSQILAIAEAHSDYRFGPLTLISCCESSQGSP